MAKEGAFANNVASSEAKNVGKVYRAYVEEKISVIVKDADNAGGKTTGV